MSWNVQSIKNKCAEVLQHISDYNADIVFLSETWMETEKNDVTAMIKESGFKMLHNRRLNREKLTGGGVGIIVKSSFNSKQINCKPFSSFEHTIVRVKLMKNNTLLLVAIYRLLFIPTKIFLKEFTEFLEMLSVMNENWIISGDINFHLETNEPIVTALKDIFKAFNLTQYVKLPTHKLGHTLDMVLGRDTSNVHNLESNNVQLSDHFMITFDVKAEAEQNTFKTVKFRNFKSDEVKKQFMSDVSKIYNQKVSDENISMGERIMTYNSSMKNLIDKHYPLKSKVIKIVPHTPWFDSEYKRLRSQRRKAEKTSRKTKSPSDIEKFVKLRKQTTQMALNKKKEYYDKKFKECRGQKEMYKCINRLLDRKQESSLPEHTSSKELANQFAKYFKEKISKIRESFPPSSGYSKVNKPFAGSPLTQFEPSTEDEIRSIIKTHGIKSAPHDPIPANLLKSTYEVFIPIWLELVNISLAQGNMNCLKEGILLPLLKEMNDITDTDLYKNYRPVTNLVFIEKLIERVVKIRFDTHMEINNLQCSKQYGYKSKHSTEMLMTKVIDDLLTTCDSKIPTLMMFLDLSAAFDTVDQEKLLLILEDELGIRDTALEWFKSFLKGRTQRVKIEDIYSDENSLDFGVAQGSILGPPLFNAYSRSFPETVQLKTRHSVKGFADDHQLLKPFNLVFQVQVLGEDLEKCFHIIELWMKEYFLKLNTSKTKIMIIAPPSIRNEILIKGCFVKGKCIRFVNVAKNLGVLFDGELSFTAQINKVVASCFSTIHQLARIKRFLSSDQLNTLICSLIFSKLDYCNALYYKLNTESIDKLQRVQNSAARLVLKVNRFDNISTNEMFQKLHWLRVKERIVFKILSIVHKCVNGEAPPEFSEMFLFVQSERTKKLVVKPCNGSMGERAISVCGPKLWNALHLKLREERCIDRFKKSLKTFLFENSTRYYEIIYAK